MSKTALITGVTGQDGAYLAELLLGKGYKVFGAYRRTSSVNFWRLDELGISGHDDLELVEFDLTDMSSAIRLVAQTAPDEIYNLAAQSFVGVSFDQPVSEKMLPWFLQSYRLPRGSAYRIWHESKPQAEA